MNCSRIGEIVDAHFARREDVVAAYLFGSLARGTARQASDVDLGLVYAEAPPATLLEQPFGDEAELASQLERPVQIVVMNGAPPDLVHRVLRDGVLLFDRDPSRRIAFEVRARNAYFDLLPVLHEYRKRRTA